MAALTAGSKKCRHSDSSRNLENCLAWLSHPVHFVVSPHQSPAGRVSPAGWGCDALPGSAAVWRIPRSPQMRRLTRPTGQKSFRGREKVVAKICKSRGTATCYCNVSHKRFQAKPGKMAFVMCLSVLTRFATHHERHWDPLGSRGLVDFCLSRGHLSRLSVPLPQR